MANIYSTNIMLEQNSSQGAGAYSTKHSRELLLLLISITSIYKRIVEKNDN
jgi:hypothetical protein